MSQEKDPDGIQQHVAGAKLDANKIDMSLLCLWPRALYEVCRVGTLGASKYSRGGFLSVPNGVIRYTAAMLRHLFKESNATYDDDPYYDTTAGAPWKGTIRHDAQVAWNALSRLEIRLREEEGVVQDGQRDSPAVVTSDRTVTIKPVQPLDSRTPNTDTSVSVKRSRITSTGGLGSPIAKAQTQ